MFAVNGNDGLKIYHKYTLDSHLQTEEITFWYFEVDQIFVCTSTGGKIINWTSRDEHERRACRYARVKFN